MSAKGSLTATLSKLLKPLGYKKKNTTWYHVNPESIYVINLQKSRWGEQFYLNVAIALRAMDDDLTPPDHKCPIRCRIGDFSADEEKWERVYLNFEDETSVLEEKVEYLIKAIRKNVLPFLETMKTQDQIKRKLLDEKMAKFFKSWAITADLKEHLGIKVGH